MEPETRIRNSGAVERLSAAGLAVLSLMLVAPATADDSLIKGQVLGGGAPIANSTVTLWAASAGAPKKLAQARTGNDGRFVMRVPGARSAAAHAVARVSEFVADFQGEISEVDINPLAVLERSAIALDCVIVPRPLTS